MSRRLGTTACLVTSLALAGSARAEGTRSTVALVRTSSNDRLLREAGTRLRAELADAGFEVVEVDSTPGDSRAQVEEAASRTSSFATVAMDRAGAGALADIWISDNVTGKTVVRRLQVGGTPNAAAVLAIRALELLRASLLEVAAKDHPSDAPAPPDILRWIEPSLPVREPAPKDLFQGYALGVSIFGLQGLRGIGLAAGPALHLSHGIGERWFGRLSLAGTVAGPELYASAGSANVRQDFASFDFGWASSPTPLGAFAWVGMGAFDLHTEGSAQAPYRATSDSVLSFLATAGIGGIARVSRQAALTAEIALLSIVPRPVVVIGDSDAGSAGAPSIGVSFGLVVGL